MRQQNATKLSTISFLFACWLIPTGKQTLPVPLRQLFVDKQGFLTRLCLHAVSTSSRHHSQLATEQRLFQSLN